MKALEKYLNSYIKSHSFPLTGSRASETGSELSQSHSVSSLDPEDEERLRQVSTRSLHIHISTGTLNNLSLSPAGL